MATSGSLYAWGAWDVALRVHLGLSDAEAQRVIIIGDVGWAFSLFVAVVAQRWGPRACAACGGAISMMGLGALLLSIRGHLSSSWPLVSIEMAVVGQGACFLYMAGYVCFQVWPPAVHGMLIGALSSLYGFSGGIYSAVWHAWFGSGAHGDNPADQDPAGFCILQLAATGAAGALGALLISEREPDLDEDSTVPSQQFRRLATFAQLPEQHHYAETNRVARRVRTFIWARAQEGEEQDRAVRTLGRTATFLGGLEKAEIAAAVEKAEEEDQSVVESDFGVTLPETLSATAALRRPQFWLLFATFTLACGVALTFVNNTGTVATSLWPGDTARGSTLALAVSLGGGVIRPLLGTAVDCMRGRRACGRKIARPAPLVLCAVSVVSVGVQLALLFDSRALAVPCAAVTGVCLGSNFCMCGVICNEEFGPAQFSLNWGILIMAAGVGPWLFNPVQTRSLSDHAPPGGGDCLGADCWKDVWYATLAASAAGAAGALLFFLCPSADAKAAAEREKWEQARDADARSAESGSSGSDSEIISVGSNDFVPSDARWQTLAAERSALLRDCSQSK